MGDPYTAMKRAEEDADILGGKSGPTLRDQFAMAALTGFLSDDGTGTDVAYMASHCYEIADAMLAARSAGDSSDG